MIRYSLIDSPAAFDRMKEGWNLLAEESVPGDPFRRHEWFRCMIESFDIGDRLHVVEARHGNEIIGIAPLVREQRRQYGLPVRTIRFIENRNTPSCDMIARPSRRDEVLRGVTSFLANESESWDEIFLDRIPAAAPNARLLAQHFREEGFPVFPLERYMSPFLRIEGSWNDYFQSRSVRFRRATRNRLNRARRAGEVKVERISTQVSFHQAREALESVSRGSWGWGKSKTLFDDPQHELFFRRLSDPKASPANFSAWLLRIDGDPAAYEFHLERDGVAYAMKSAFDERFRDVSPGSVLDFHVVRALFEEGYREYDMGNGDQFYKSNWTEQKRHFVAVRVYNRTAASTLLRLLECRLLPLARRLRDQFGIAPAPEHRPVRPNDGDCD